ncbi:hypothetical protein N826_36510 [Skermanella aerolata KACC 11604]|nr:hypothetical protein N826_36510 [Skermanella aerolata KACC 11604]
MRNGPRQAAGDLGVERRLLAKQVVGAGVPDMLQHEKEIIACFDIAWPERDGPAQDINAFLDPSAHAERRAEVIQNFRIFRSEIRCPTKGPYRRSTPVIRETRGSQVLQKKRVVKISGGHFLQQSYSLCRVTGCHFDKREIVERFRMVGRQGKGAPQRRLSFVKQT